MQTTFALLALAAVAYAAPQGVTADITPTAVAPAGCTPTYTGEFQIQAVNFTTPSKRSVEKRDCGAAGSLTITLAGGQLTDMKGRTGYIANNSQFQFDGPPQAGALLTGGFTACQNGSLALGGSAVWWECYSGGFYNLYDVSQGLQCYPILLDIISCGGSSSAVVGASTDGQATGTAVATEKTDGQPQVTTAVAISEYSDGQPQVPTAVPICQIKDGQIQAGCTTAAPVPTKTATPLCQITDGQVQAGCTTLATSTLSPVCQITDGQVQAGCTTATTAAPISQISDGQIQAGTATVKPTTAAPISQIGDGQVQVGNATVTSTAKPVQVTANAASSLVIGSEFAAAIVGLFAVVLL